ncbi:hypothetical protein ASD01_17355 [Ensifer sp. Root423]|uniref:hypothetical protein n=1 Tax=Ensifer sp. Root423 TaxID=1736534 RepID=UPI000715887C|nr:hypothetical protein [Ensifer sp. Root423]KQX03044.1 hypothetical protein ASD01_17355 [Ensifer sp. Root423]
MAQVHIVAIDLAQTSFQVCGTDRGGAYVDAPGLARRFFGKGRRNQRAMAVLTEEGCSELQGYYFGFSTTLDLVPQSIVRRTAVE